MNLRKAISPILATVIIIAVTLVIAIGVIGWIMGLWGSLGSTEALKVTPIEFCYDSNKQTYNLTLQIGNSGTAPATIKVIQIIGLGENKTAIKPDVIPQGGTETVKTTINVPSGSPPTVGATYQVKVITTSGNVYTTYVTYYGSCS